MLYDPKWSQPTLRGFIEWLEEQPADGWFAFGSARDCALGQYYRSLGREPEWQLDDIAKELGVNSDRFRRLISQCIICGTTFGNMLVAMRELAP